MGASVSTTASVGVVVSSVPSGVRENRRHQLECHGDRHQQSQQFLHDATFFLYFRPVQQYQKQAAVLSPTMLLSAHHLTAQIARDTGKNSTILPFSPSSAANANRIISAPACTDRGSCIFIISTSEDGSGQCSCRKGSTGSAAPAQICTGTRTGTYSEGSTRTRHRNSYQTSIHRLYFHSLPIRMSAFTAFCHG